jgi:hypothetical protein
LRGKTFDAERFVRDQRKFEGIAPRRSRPFGIACAGQAS